MKGETAEKNADETTTTTTHDVAFTRELFLRSSAHVAAVGGHLHATHAQQMADSAASGGFGGALAQMKAQLPLEDEEELEMLDTLVESLHGERLTRVLVQRGDEDFLARRTLVQWLYLTQPDLNLF